MSELPPQGDTESSAKDAFSEAAAEHRLGAAYSADLVSISRRVLYAQAVVIAMIAAIFFMAGYVIAPGKTKTVDTPVEKKERFGKTVDVYGKITFKDAVGGFGYDAGAVVILLPKDSDPSDRFASKGLRPTDATPDNDDAGAKAIEFLGGAYLRADENGEIDMEIRSGRYHVLVISSSAQRDEGRKIRKQDVESLKKFFADPSSLIGDQRYKWTLEKFGKESFLNVSLE